MEMHIVVCCCDGGEFDFADVVKQKELVLYPNKNGCVRDLLEEARKQVTVSSDVGSGRLRFAVVLSNIIVLRFQEMLCVLQL